MVSESLVVDLNILNVNMVPIIKQYLKIKKKYPKILLFYQIGDFYELFYDDAKKVSYLLNISLTKKKFVRQKDVPMAGVPLRTADMYISKLINLGESVVLCNQVLDEKNDINKKLIVRKVARIITPGTVSEDKFLNSFKDNYIASIWSKNNKCIFGYSFLDISSGRFYILEIYGLDRLKHYLLNTNPSEIICCRDSYFLKDIKWLNCFKYVSKNKFNFNKNYLILKNHFGLSDLSSFGIHSNHLGINPAGCILNYIKSTQFVNFSYINKLKLINDSKFIFMDSFTVKNLELIDSISGDYKNTLFNVLNNVVTPMGRRMLKRWILFPIRDINKLYSRHNIMEFLRSKFIKIRFIFSKIGDIERILGRISLKTVISSDLINLKNYLFQILNFVSLFKFKSNIKIIDFFIFNKKIISNIINLIDNSISDPDLDKKNLIIKGYNDKLDNLYKSLLDYKNKILLIEKKEKKKTKIKSLFLNRNNIYGYYIQINKNDSNLVPKYYIKLQTLKHSSKYMISDLKIYENKLINLKRKINFLEKNIFNHIISIILKNINYLKIISNNVSKLDVLMSFLDRSYVLNYKKPIFTSSNILKIINGRHPIVERNVNNVFIPNNLIFDEKNRFLVITGPNMGGKSTYMRQIVLICIMAYIGSYVPADSLVIGPIDKILTRIGFSDDITNNKSTFMVEMNEISSIINNATFNSIILIDEMGRGTSYFEGVSLAWSCLYYIVKYIKSMLLFATHFYELTNMSNILCNIKNIYFDYIIKNNDLILLYKIKDGVCCKSFSLNIFKKIGFPKLILKIFSKKFKNNILGVHDKKFLIDNNLCFNKKHNTLFDIILNINWNSLSVDKLINKIKILKNMCNKM